MIDVAIIGGGPAGSAAAIALARAGRSAVVIERTRYGNARIGETVPPTARLLLGQLDAIADFENAGHMPAPGIVSVWGDAEPYTNDFIVNPYGNGWHLDRARFDRMLSACAREAGARVYEQSTVTMCESDDDGWHIGLRNDAGDAAIACRFVVDASGRRASPFKRRAGRREVYDRLVGIAAFMPGAANSDTRALIESTSGGWWYSTPLPDRGQVVVFMTDADTIRCGRGELAGFLRRKIQGASHTRERCGGLPAEARVTPFAAMTYRYTQIHGGRWLLAGDAAATWDPLSGQGICKALESGIAAARAIDRALDGDDQGLDDYAQSMRTQFDNYLRSRAKFYGVERRWPDAPFWSRRHVAV